jgi:hypothetical protein
MNGKTNHRGRGRRRSVLFCLLALLIVLTPGVAAAWLWSGMAAPAELAPGQHAEIHYLDDSSILPAASHSIPACPSGRPVEWQTPNAPPDTTRSLEPLLRYPDQQTLSALQVTPIARKAGPALFDLPTGASALSLEERVAAVWLVAGSLCALWLLVQNRGSVPHIGAGTWMSWVFLGLVIGPLAFWLCRRNGLAAR